MNNKDWNWIFDWSGTLVDDLALVICATNHVMRIYNKPELNRTSFRKLFKLPYTEFYSESIPGVSLDDIERHFREGMRISKEHVTILPETLHFLDYIKSKNQKMYILTSVGKGDFERQLKDLHLSSYFNQTYAGVLDKRESIKSIVSKNSLKHDKTIFVGDMIHDIETAEYGGIFSVAVLTGYNDRKQLQSSKPGLIVKNLSDLRKLLDAELEWSLLFNQ